MRVKDKNYNFSSSIIFDFWVIYVAVSYQSFFTMIRRTVNISFLPFLPFLQSPLSLHSNQINQQVFKHLIPIISSLINVLWILFNKQKKIYSAKATNNTMIFMAPKSIMPMLFLPLITSLAKYQVNGEYKDWRQILGNMVEKELTLLPKFGKWAPILCPLTDPFPGTHKK